MTSNQCSILTVAMVTQGVAIGLSYGMFPILLQPIEEVVDASRAYVNTGQVLRHWDFRFRRSDLSRAGA